MHYQIRKPPYSDKYGIGTGRRNEMQNQMGETGIDPNVFKSLMHEKHGLLLMGKDRLIDLQS